MLHPMQLGVCRTRRDFLPVLAVDILPATEDAARHTDNILEMCCFIPVCCTSHKEQLLVKRVLFAQLMTVTHKTV